MDHVFLIPKEVNAGNEDLMKIPKGAGPSIKHYLIPLFSMFGEHCTSTGLFWNRNEAFRPCRSFSINSTLRQWKCSP